MTKDSSDNRKTGAPQSESVAIIGLSCLFPGADNQAGYWASIKKSVDSIVDVPPDHWSAADYYDPDPKAEDRTYGRRGGFLSAVPFEPLKYGIVPNDLSAIDTTQLLGLVAADIALADSGYGADNGYDHSRTAVMLGVTGALKMVVSLGSRLAHPQLRRALADSGVDQEAAAEVLKRFANEFTPWQENSFPGLLGNVTAGRIANRLNLGGSNLVVDAACASSLAAVRQGLMELASGQADLVVTGGVDTFSDPFMYTCFSKTPALSPTGDVRAYDQDGDGTMLGEGIGIVVLKRLSEAERDGDRIYAVIRAVGSSSDGKGAAIFAPTAEGQVRALRNAYAAAGFTPDTVGLVEGHGTGTAVGDAVEVAALDEVFGQSLRAASGQPWCALGSVKSQIGHTKAAAGAAGLIKTALSLYLKTLPPNVKVKTPLPILTAPGSPFHLSTKPRPWLSAGPRRAGVSAFGFGGSNFHCLLEEASPEKSLAEGPFDFEFFAFSGQTPADIAHELAQVLTAEPFRLAAARSRAGFSSAASCRLVILADGDKFSDLAQRVITTLSNPEFTEADLPDNIFYGHGPAQVESCGFLLPGPGSARQDMFRELALDWPQLHRALNEAARQWAESAPDQPSLDLLLYPPDLASEECLQSWAATFAAEQPRTLALRAVCRGLEEILEQFGLRPAAVISCLETPANIVQELNRKGYQDIGLWLEIGPGDSLGRQAAEILGQDRVLALDQNGGTHLDIARLLARLTTKGLPLDLTAWPVPPFEPAPAENRPEKTFTMMISGANQFTKRDIPPSPPRVSTPPALTSEDGRSAVNALEALTAETARVHQEFLNHQAEAMRLLGQSLESNQLPAHTAATKRPEPAIPTAVAASIEADSRPETPASPISEIAEAVLKVVADETGYPREMLRLDMNLEGDLGLDSIKKVEIMAVLSEKMPGVQGLGAETMNNAATLRDLVALVTDETPVVAAAPASVERAQDPDLWPLLREVVSRETGYPRDMLTPQMRLGDDLGLDSIKMVEIASVISEQLPDAGTLSAEILNEAQTLEDLARALENPGTTTPAVSRPSLEATATAAPTSGGFAAPQTTEVVLEVVSRETGYPKDMLNMSMNLEADLGLDSIKKVEIMAALSERLPQVEALTTAEVMAGLETLGDLAALADGGNSSSAPLPMSSATGLGTGVPAAEQLQAELSAASKSISPDELLLDVVAAETGYPKDMLSFSATLEADLGLDSIKRVEIMAALSEKLGDDNLAAASAERLNEALTLGDLRDLLTKSMPAGGISAPLPPPPVEMESLEPPKRKAGRPPKNSPPAFKADNAVETEVTTTSVASFRVEMLPVPISVAGADSFGLSPEAKVFLLADPSLLAEELEKLLADQGLSPERIDWAESGRLASRMDIEGLIMIWPGETNSLDLPKTAFKALQAAGPAVAAAAERGLSPLVMGLTFIGGSFGFANSAPITAPSCGALGGLLKTAAREWPGVRVRSIDLPAAAYGPEAAYYLPGLMAAADPSAPVELGLAEADKLMTPGLTPYKSKNIRVRHLREGQTLLVTGGARGVTAAALKELARSFKPRLVILGRTPMPQEEPKWLRNLGDEAAVRQALFDRAQVKPSPRELASRSAAIMAGREIKENLTAMERAGAKVTYISGDFGSPETLKATTAEIKRLYGPVHGFLHGAGVLADSLILDKKDEDFDLVFNTKARMAEHILAELAGQPLNFVAFFSSSTARFGRRGQADYAAGNEVLNKLARAMSGNRQAPKCLSINWGPWAGGMVDAGLSRLFETEGIGLIPLAEGARLFTTLAGGPKNDPVELVVLGPNTNLADLGK